MSEIKDKDHHDHPDHKKNKKERSTAAKWTRRGFIAAGGLAGIGLVVGIGGNMYLNKAIKKYTGEGMGDGSSMNAWVRIAPDNTITLAVPRAEMGQGVYTSIPQILAEELEVDMNQITIVHPQPESPYANTYVMPQNTEARKAYASYTFFEKVASFLPVVATGGSTSIVDAYDHLRGVGATAREMLVHAAADKWGVSPKDCYAESAFVINKETKEKLSYGSLSEAAAGVELSSNPPLKAQKDFKVIGKPVQRLDIPEKVTGKAEFGIDARPEGMLVAAIRHASYVGGTVTGVTNEEEIMKMRGVKKVLMLENGLGAAVVADNTWRAKNAAMALDLEESANSLEEVSSSDISKMLNDIIDSDKMFAPHEAKGDVAAALENGKVVEAAYEVPYLSQCTMEPLNCTMVVNDGSAEVWVGHQGGSLVRDAVNAVAGIAKDKIKVNITYLGGGYGRKAELDYIQKSAMVAKQMQGTPIQLIFTREEDMKNGMYRPAVASKFKATIGDDGKIDAWENKMALQSVGYSSMNRIMPAMAQPPEKDAQSTEGAIHLPYGFKNSKVAFGQLELDAMQVGNWRSVGASQNGFFTESFMDEMAHAAGQDPYEFRRKHIEQSDLPDADRYLAVLNKVASMANWSTPLGEGKSRGIAILKSFDSIVGQVAEVTKLGDKQIKIDKVYCVIDCGRIVNPDTVEAQMQSGIVYGLSAALFGEITMTEGQIDQQNFPQYEMVRMNTSPTVQVHIMEVDEYPGGVGEPGTPPAAPAVANAIFAATGDRVRSLPLIKHGYTFA